ncbi:MAG: aldose 1-epimerase family protein [Anaerolineae bacterium]
MPELFGHTYTRDQLTRMVGDMSQLAGVRLGSFEEGNARGVRVADVHTGSGLCFSVLLDRALDIGAASFQGRSLAWHATSGWAEGARYEPEGLGWLRSWGGGLMTGCGMSWMGAPSVDGEEALGLHGRMSHLAAYHVNTGAAWEGDAYNIWVEGEIKEAVTFGAKLHLKRRISTQLGATWLRIHDRVTNIGYQPAPHMLLYHVNFGFPVVSPESELIADIAETTPRTEIAATGIDVFRQFQEPTPGYAEQVFYHILRTDADGFAQAAIVNRALDFGAYVRYRAAELPWLIEWKMMGAQDYVCGLEPTTAWADGRDKARRDGQLKVLEPQEAVEYALEIGVLPTREAIEGFAS